MTNAISLAKQFGVIEEPTPEVQAEIERLKTEHQQVQKPISTR